MALRPILYFIGVFIISIGSLSAQKDNKLNTYYLPDIKFDESISTPKEVLGFEVGDWHISHDKLLFYLHTITKQSDRLTMDTIGYTHEQRPLVHLTITAPRNHQNIDKIRQNHVALTESGNNQNIENMPVVVWQGYSIHGNEASGSNAAVLYAYYLAAATGDDIQNKLDNAVIILDPCFNPDGLNRFASWVNMHKSSSMVTDPNRRETNEPFPRGRTNHYWFDLNRDWLPVQQPESKARLKQFHHWKPNVLTDHHEMGTNSTFFFQPGVPQRTNPITPNQNQILTGKIGDFHAKALDKIGSLYYSKESFDDFYYGKGSTYPDVNGAIGILFEQASARGHAQDSRNGVLTFDFAIRNQLTTSLSTLEAAVSLRKDLLSYQKEFYNTVNEFASSSKEKGYLIGGKSDLVRLNELSKILDIHQIDYYRPSKETKNGQASFATDNSIVIPVNQTQGRLVKAMFDEPKAFKDSIFYDVSAWTLSHAFDLNKKNLSSSELSNLKGEQLSSFKMNEVSASTAKSNIGYLIDWKNYYAPALINQLLENNLIVKVNELPFYFNQEDEKRMFTRGTIFVKTPSEKDEADKLLEMLQKANQNYGIRFVAAQTGLTQSGIDLGSPSFQNLSLPKVLIVVGSGVSSYDAGEIWHLLDLRMKMKVSLVEAEDLSRIDLGKYNTIVLPSSYPQGLKTKTLSDWVKNGGNLVAFGSAVNWLSGDKSFNIKSKESESRENQRLRYEKRGADRGAQYIGGAILKANLDMSHPLAYGYESEQIAVFKNNRIFLDPTQGRYNMPLVYDEEEPILSGYLSEQNKERAAGSVGILTKNLGGGQVILFADNPNFRAFWYGTNKLFLNAIFFGDFIRE